ncbi:MAG: hypothetical protein PHF93_09660 [Acidobacteriota bacterium]|nr:hypothetical protein [Acidobacteriota bacterium]MDD8034072.1 hypothetical protein [Acidobacteriota bacterium]HNT32070.1 hypothetical protein [Candidatus Aminicenantes bacterium]HOS11197.1 hypothetical protein [Candidatus Aminicenantes bacterium]HOY99996.1 hypothetical protein [Candidatus Aminicenantes bacterium]
MILYHEPGAGLYNRGDKCYLFDRNAMVNYILLYKIKKKVKAMIKDKLALGEIATTPSSCLDCLATDLSWEIYYLMKEKSET